MRVSIVLSLDRVLDPDMPIAEVQRRVQNFLNDLNAQGIKASATVVETRTEFLTDEAKQILGVEP